MSDGLEVERVFFAAGGNAIVRGVSLHVPHGETLAVLGPSGCGKTTLLRLIAGLERPDHGTVSMGGVDLAGVPAHRRNFGMVFQDFALFPHMNVQRNIAFGLRKSLLSKADTLQRVAELLSMVGLEGFERRTTEALSGGERQRVALARALAPDPRLLLFDEPLGSLDRGLRERLLVELRAILDRLTIPAIYVTHDQFEAFAVADRMAIMRAGRIVGEGTPQALYAAPGTEFVARFLGFSNVVDAQLDARGVATTRIGRWSGVDGPAGAIRLLLRNEGATIAGGPGESIVSGNVASRLFQGGRQRLELEANGEKLEFEFETSTLLPAAGEVAHVRVASVQVLVPEPPDTD